MHIIVFCDFFAETDRPLLIGLNFVNRGTNGLRKLVLLRYKTVIFILICFGVSIYNDGASGVPRRFVLWRGTIRSPTINSSSRHNECHIVF